MQIGNKVSAITKAGLVQMAKTTNVLRNINYENFSSSFDSTGVNLEYRPPPTTSTDENKYHFKIEANTTSGAITDLICRGGYWSRESHDLRKDIANTCDVGTYTGDYDNSYKSLTISNTAGRFIYAELDNSMDPTTCEIKTSASWPVYNVNKSNQLIAFANCNSGTLSVNQYWNSDIVDKFEKPDTDDIVNKSIDRSPFGDLELYNFNNTSVLTYAVEVAGDGLGNRWIVYLPTSQTPTNCDLTPSNAGTFAVGLSRGDHNHKILDSLHANFADTATWANTGAWPTSFYHYNLIDISANQGGDDHHPDVSQVGYVVCSNNGESYARNNMYYGLGDQGGAASVGVNDRKLYETGGTNPSVEYAAWQLRVSNVATVNWSCCWAKSTDTNMSIDWGLRKLQIGATSKFEWGTAGKDSIPSATILEILSSEAGNIGTTTGALRITGGLTAQARSAIAVGGIYTTFCDASIAITSGDGTHTCNICDSTYSVNTLGGINVDSGHTYCHAAVAGMNDITGNWALVNKNDGSFKTVYIRGGILCAS